MMLKQVQHALLAGVLALLVPIGAGALTMTPDPIAFNNGTDIGTITLIGTVTGLPAGGSVLAGAVGVGDITLIFQVTVTSGAVESLGIGVLDTSPFGGLSSTAAGWIPGGDTDITGVTGTAGARIFDFDGDGQLDAGQTSDFFFISYSALEGDETQKVNFMVNGSVGADIPLSTTLLPEPAVLSLLGLGLGAVALVGARRRR